MKLGVQTSAGWIPHPDFDVQALCLSNTGAQHWPPVIQAENDVVSEIMDRYSACRPAHRNHRTIVLKKQPFVKLPLPHYLSDTVAGLNSSHT